jgi:hypothetical protein
MINAHDARVRSAIDNTRQHHAEYWQKCLAMRAGMSPEAQGSIYPYILPEHLDRALNEARGWTPYPHESVMAGCEAFITFHADAPGLLGIVPTRSLPSNTKIRMDDLKGTGFCEPVVVGVPTESVGFTVAILGKDEADREIVFTFHPGNPIKPSRLSTFEYGGKTLTVPEALDAGLNYVRLAKE